jgi:hypothetical protein
MPPVRFVTVYGQKMAYYDLSNGPVLVLGFGTSVAICLFIRIAPNESF